MCSAAVPWKGADIRARRKAVKAAIDAMPPFRRITGPATRLHVKATLRAALNDAIGQQIIAFNPAAHVEAPYASRTRSCGRTSGSPSGSRRPRSRHP